MISSSHMLPSVAILAVALTALPTSTNSFDIMSLISDDFLNLIPETCKDGTVSEWEVALGCASERGCVAILPEFENLEIFSNPENVTECEDIQEPFCAIANTCTPCTEAFDDLIRCTISNTPSEDPMIGGNVTELVDSCVLATACGIITESLSDTPVDTPVDATANAPTIAPAPTDDVPAPTDDAPSPTDDVPAPTDDVPAPTDDASAPTDDVPAPTDDVPAPTDDASAPTDDVPAPTDDASAPTDDVPTALSIFDSIGGGDWVGVAPHAPGDDD